MPYPDKIDFVISFCVIWKFYRKTIIIVYITQSGLLINQKESGERESCTAHSAYRKRTTPGAARAPMAVTVA